MSKRPRVIGICGYARSGKDTARQHIEKKYGYDGRAFADALRTIMWKLNPMVDCEGGVLIRYQDALDKYGYDEAKNRYPLVREMLVAMGVGCRDVLSPTVWLDKILPLGYDGSEIVVSDVRFPEEAQRVKKLGGILIEITRPGVVAPNEEEARNHPLLAPHVSICNDGTKEDLGKRLDDVLSGLML